MRVCEWVTMCLGYCSYAACAKKTNSNSRQHSQLTGCLPAPMPCKPFAAPPPHLALLSSAYTFNNNEELGAKSIAFSAGPLPRQSSRHSRAPLSLSLSLPPLPLSICLNELHFGHSIGNRSNRTHTTHTQWQSTVAIVYK